MTQDYTDLAETRSSRGYQKLQALWVKQGADIMKALNKASREKGKDESLRYYAGLWFGFDAAIGQLERALDEISRTMENKSESSKVDDILSKLNDRRGENIT